MPTHDRSISASGLKACDAYRAIIRAAERLNEELDDVTSPGGIQVANLDREDSMVTSIEDVIKTTEPVRQRAVSATNLQPMSLAQALATGTGTKR